MLTSLTEFKRASKMYILAMAVCLIVTSLCFGSHFGASTC